jgi:hypothetical protein
VDGEPLNISALASAGRLALSFTNRVKFRLARRVAMRLRTLINRLVWFGLAAYLGYAALLAAASYYQVKETIEQAVTDSLQRQKAAVASGRTTAAAPEQAVDVRAAILLATRRASLPIEAGKLVLKPEGERLRISLHWPCVVLTVADEVAFAVPLWMDRTFDVRP